MPFARLTYRPQRPDREDHLAQALTDLIARDLAKRHDLTSVLIEATPASRWTIGGEPQATAAHLEVFVTAGTNSPKEKRAFLQNAMTLLRAEWPELHAATYVVVHELPSTDWGYDGLSQADRAANR
ncbi:tautomerase family protein [Rhizobium sp. G187]|uniref:tautomerase family protein n=1 Tax=Rhizobium sp. G187 TaxID=3451352 RepID=UPI003EE4E85A